MFIMAAYVVKFAFCDAEKFCGSTGSILAEVFPTS